MAEVFDDYDEGNRDEERNEIGDSITNQDYRNQSVMDGDLHLIGERDDEYERPGNERYDEILKSRIGSMSNEELESNSIIYDNKLIDLSKVGLLDEEKGRRMSRYHDILKEIEDQINENRIRVREVDRKERSPIRKEKDTDIDLF